MAEMSAEDRQFQADLERAQALSLESLALEQFRRNKSDSNASSSSRRSSEQCNGTPPALPPPPRRPSRQRSSCSENQPVAVQSGVRSSSASPSREDKDLICFASPKPATKEPHESLKEYIEQLNKLSLKTEEVKQDKAKMNPYYNPNNPYPPYNYNYPNYNPLRPPYPSPGFGVNSPGFPNYGHFSSPPGTFAASPTGNYTANGSYPSPSSSYAPSPTGNYGQINRHMSAPYPNTIPFSQTRMASPIPYMGYPPSPQYNYTTTNMISRPIRPVHNSPSMYPQLPQPIPYQTYSTTSSSASTSQVQKPSTPPETPNSCRPDFSRKSSEASVTSDESNDTVGSLPKSLNLIDFNGHNGASSQGSVRVSVLEAFDPLLTDQNVPEYACASECSGSVYDEYDPLDFLYGETEMREAPLYAVVNKRDKDGQQVPSPPPKSMPSVPAVTRPSTTNKLYDAIVKIRHRNYDSEHRAFLEMIKEVRSEFVHGDERSNPGHVVAARSGGKYPPNTSVKILVHHDYADEPIIFTSDVESTVEHVIMTVVCSLEEETREDMADFQLRVWGVSEYLTAGSSLSEYDYIRQCVRLEKDIRLFLQKGKDRSLARTERDDARDTHITLDELFPNQAMSPLLSFDNLSILLETLEGELSRAIGVVGGEGSCAPNGVVQAVKAVCALAGGVETLHVSHTLAAFTRSCSSQGCSGVVKPEIVGETGQYCNVSLRSATPKETVAMQCGRVRDAVRGLVALYTRTHLVDFRLADTMYLMPSSPDKAVPAHTVSETFLFCIEAVHRFPPCWRHDEYLFHIQAYHGTRPLKRAHLSPCVPVENTGFYPRILFDTWCNLEDISIYSIPREARLVITLYGRTARAQETAEKEKDDAGEKRQQDMEHDVQFEQEELGWTAIQLYDYDGILASGNYILPIWPTSTDKRLGPAPHPMHTPSQTHPVVNIEIPLYTHTGVKWSGGGQELRSLTRTDLPSFDSLDGHTQSQLLHFVEQGAYQRMPTEGREVLWEKRQYLVDIPGALPLVILAATNWYGEHRAQLINLVRLWNMPSALNAMHLLLPCFPDCTVREIATQLVSTMSDDALSCVLPQLVQVLRHECSETSALARLLLARALRSPAVAHRLYWLLVHSLPGNLPQNSSQEFLGISLEESAASPEEGEGHVVFCWRYLLMLRALLAVCGENLSKTLLKQQLLVKCLSDVAYSVKSAKDGSRQRALTAGVEQVAGLIRTGNTALPLGLSKEVHDIDVKSCSYFSSNTLPLKINFIGTDNAVIPAMFKVGDDLRQDALVLQVMRVMDCLWLNEGLDLRMVTFQAIPTNNRRGMIEIVTEAETLRAIQTEWGLTGSFKDRPIAEWLAKHNPSELEYERARDNFTASCAGYSVATYLLGICDRHNDNIMLKTSGHLFHIDFGKFLGDAQMFGNFKRDRAPFVLTHDMAYVINGGERPTQRFHYFVELCCMAFNIVRAHHNHILDLFALMASSGVPGVTMAAVTYVRSALLPGATQAEAAAAFAKLIHSSLKSKFTPINFFLHNLAQLRASGDQGSSSSELLSFMPRTYTMAQDGRLHSVEVLGYEKRYDPEKHYVYSLRVHRTEQTTPSVLYRSYRHFTELYQKICMHFPLAKVHSLPSGLHVGRSNTRQVAERRFADVQAFLTSLFSLADEIAHSDLVYTFFHPLLRDQQDAAPQRLKHKEQPEAENRGSGSIKISVQYTAGVLSVLILHAQSLALTPQGLPPNTYVKVYLVPDPTKATKRKTRVVKRNSHPSFMEMLEYRLPLDVVVHKNLQATVWHYDSLQENQFLGGVVIPLNSIPLRQETVSWYPLEYIPR